MQFVPLPRMKPLQPSSRHIFARALPTGSLYSLWPALCTWYRIFNRSRGETTVLDTAPATPPPQKAATTGCEKKSRKGAALSSALGAALIASSEVCKKNTASQSLFLQSHLGDNTALGTEGCDLQGKLVPNVQLSS
jgi:hypothetical protein